MGTELQSIIENIDTKDVKEVMSQASKSYEELNSKRYTRNKEKYPMILNDIVKYELYLLDGCNNVDEENKPKSGKIMIYLCQLKLTFQQISKSFVLHLVLILKILKLENSMHLNMIVNLLYMIYCRITLIISIFKNGVNKKT